MADRKRGAIQTDLEPPFKLLIWGFVALLAWTPWLKPTLGANLAGCAVIFWGLTKLARVNARFGQARWYFAGAGLILLIDLIAPVRAIPSRGVIHHMPMLFMLAELGAALGVWLLAGGMIEEAAARDNIALRRAAAGRRDLFLTWIVAKALLAGPMIFLFWMHKISPQTYQVMLWGVVLLQYAVLVAWAMLCADASRGFEGEEGVL